MERIPNNCEILKRAKILALKRDLDPNLVTCNGCVEGADCNYSGEDQLPLLLQDRIQDIVIKKIEGQFNLNKFYKRLERHFEITGASK